MATLEIPHVFTTRLLTPPKHYTFIYPVDVGPDQHIQKVALVRRLHQTQGKGRVGSIGGKRNPLAQSPFHFEESHQQAAQRELAEETGLQQIELRRLGAVYWIDTQHNITIGTLWGFDMTGLTLPDHTTEGPIEYHRPSQLNGEVLPAQRYIIHQLIKQPFYTKPVHITVPTEHTVW